KDPAERVDAEEADRLLAAVLQAKPAAAARDAPPPGVSRRIGRAVVAAAVAAAVGVAAGAVAYFRSSGPAEGSARLAQRAAATSPMPSAPQARSPTPAPTPTITATAAATPPPLRNQVLVRPWTSPLGWSIHRPAGWRGVRGEYHAEWTHPRRAGHLSVEAVYATLDPNQLIRDEEEALRAGGVTDLRTLATR